jgi:hypothetical protein
LYSIPWKMPKKSSECGMLIRGGQILSISFVRSDRQSCLVEKSSAIASGGGLKKKGSMRDLAKRKELSEKQLKGVKGGAKNVVIEGG